ncbi:MAG: PDZ domain-containing protein [bacterium]
MRLFNSKFPLLALTLSLVLAAFGVAQAETPWLGIYMQNITDELAEAFDLSVTNGVLINNVVYGSPAQKAGIERGDVILAWGDQKIRDTDRLSDLVADSKVGDKVDLLVLRDGKEKDIAVEIAEQQWPHYTINNSDKFLTAFDGAFNGGIGVSIQALTGDLGEYFGVADGAGALITEVHEDTPAAKAGLKAGDVIVAVDGHKVETPSDVRELLAEHEEGEQAELTVVRERQEQTFAVEVEDLGIYGLGSLDFSKLPQLRKLDRYHNVPNFQMPNFQWWSGEQRGPRTEDLESHLEILDDQLRQLERKLERLEDKLD